MGVEESYNILVAGALVSGALSLGFISYSLGKTKDLFVDLYEELKGLRQDLKKNKDLEDKTEGPL